MSASVRPETAPQGQQATPPQTQSGDVLDAAETAQYWDKRHRGIGDLRSGGDRSYDETTNEIFYTLRLGRLLDAIGDRTDVLAPLDVLDAGSGKGWFARSFARFGHRVDGIDVSPAAVAHARRLGGGPSYHVSTLSGWRGSVLYDVVYSVDVLFHIMEDAEWEASLRNLAAHVRLGGLLMVADWSLDEHRVWGAYQVSRARSQYVELITSLGLRDDGFVPYGFRDSKVGLHVFTRWC